MESSTCFSIKKEGGGYPVALSFLDLNIYMNLQAQLALHV